MKDFFKVQSLALVKAHIPAFGIMDIETVSLTESLERVLALDILSDVDIPDFMRATMDGYAVSAQSTFGASEGNAAYLSIQGSVAMGEIPSFAIGPGEAAKISTGGMLPRGANAVVMVEHTEALDPLTLEVYKSVAPGQHMVDVGEDFKKGEPVLFKGKRIRPQEAGFLAAMGKEAVKVYKKPRVGILSTGDEIVPVSQTPGLGKIRDINSHTLASLVSQCGGTPVMYGITGDNPEDLYFQCKKALEETDMVLISGGSSVGARDFTLSTIHSLPDASVLVHGISISPGKPTILARIQNKPFWGLPGHVVSAMVVFSMVVKPFLQHISGLSETEDQRLPFPAVLSRNIASAQGRTDFIRVKLARKNGTLFAEPVLGKSGLINTMIKADGLIEIGENMEGLDQGTPVDVILM
ncbi:MAG: molybdopterin molybdotransferase MoeA [Desulfobacteraceae bacterium]|nr:molybdopterin molybdotransferase MoeA [Desulfobacteraceae bacterium]MBU4054074.1 molybdopterin molybdotransferase MoeA [Pseudomonadota bacterium]